jgi:aminopeptidase N
VFIDKKISGCILSVCCITSVLMMISLCSTAQPLSQKKTFTLQDSLRGSITPERAWWNVTRYDITVEPDYTNKTIQGISLIHFKTTAAGKLMQIDLQEPMMIDSIIERAGGRSAARGSRLNFKRNGNVWYVDFGRTVAPSTEAAIQIYYHGKPREAVRPPWDGGWIWKKDQKGRPWITVACQGLGASVWFPCKDHQSDEPDNGASLQMIVPDTLVAVANGRLTDKRSEAGKAFYTWEVKNPINNYTIIPYIGKYVHWNEKYNGEKGTLDCDYWVLDYDLEKAKPQFKQALSMLKCFEHWFGPYPFYEDGFKLVEAPHLGMEHQSAVAYGNGFRNGYLGRDLSGSGWGSKWDFIIVHESGHEWFANNITSNDIADMWVHEGFTAYSETLYTTCEFGIEAGNAYVIGTRRLIESDKPVIGPYGVNQEGSGDMYYKGSNMLHTIRQIIGDDEKFRKILRGLNSVFYHKTVNSSDIEHYISKQSGKDLSKVFDQYLRTTRIPVLEYEINGAQLKYRWSNCVNGFNMPLRLSSGEWIQPTEAWKTTNFSGSELKADPNFYVQIKKMN